MSDTPIPPSGSSQPGSVPLINLTEEQGGALHPEDSVETAGDCMRENHASAWPVTENRKLVGIIDEENPDWKIGGRGHDPKTRLVGQIMTREVVSCYEDEDCATAEKVMEEHGLVYLPVVDRQMRIVGIFSRKMIQERADAPVSGKVGNPQTTVPPPKKG